MPSESSPSPDRTHRRPERKGDGDRGGNRQRQKPIMRTARNNRPERPQHQQRCSTQERPPTPREIPEHHAGHERPCGQPRQPERIRKRPTVEVEDRIQYPPRHQKDHTRQHPAKSGPRRTKRSEIPTPSISARRTRRHGPKRTDRHLTEHQHDQADQQPEKRQRLSVKRSHHWATTLRTNASSPDAAPDGGFGVCATNATPPLNASSISPLRASDIGKNPDSLSSLYVVRADGSG